MKIRNTREATYGIARLTWCNLSRWAPIRQRISRAILKIVMNVRNKQTKRKSRDGGLQLLQRSSQQAVELVRPSLQSLSLKLLGSSGTGQPPFSERRAAASWAFPRKLPLGTGGEEGGASSSVSCWWQRLDRQSATSARRETGGALAHLRSPH